MKSKKLTFRARVWVWPGSAPWHFVTLPQDESQIISELYGWGRRGFGSLRVEVTIGQSVWKTSIFPDKKRGAYLLPLKASIRKSENIMNNDLIAVKISLLI